MKFENLTQGNFTIIQNQIIDSSELSLKAKGLYLFLARQSSTWEFYESEMLKRMTDGKKSLRSGLKELEEAGLLIKMQVRKNNKFGGTKMVLKGYEALKDDMSTVYPKGDDTKRDDTKGDDTKGATNKTNTNNTNKNKTKEKRERTSQKRVNPEASKLKNFIDLEHWIKENAKKLDGKKRYKYADEDYQISKQGKLWNSDTLKDADFRTGNEILKMLLSKIKQGEMQLCDMVR